MSEIDEGKLERIDMFGNSRVAHWRVWEDQDERMLEVSVGSKSETALLTIKEESRFSYKKAAWRIFQRLSSLTVIPH